MSKFEDAIPVILKNEGGFVDDPRDHGGATNFGISLAYAKSLGLMLDVDHDGDVDAQDMKKLTRAQATEVYRTQWWDKLGYGQINNQLVATKIFDMAVNMGPGMAAKLAQRACNSVGANIAVDGGLGPKSFAAINAVDPAVLLSAIKEHQEGFYKAIVARDPTQSGFLSNWLYRASWPPENVA